MEILRIEIIGAFGAGTRLVLATETRNVAAGLKVGEAIVARTSRDGQNLRNDVEVSRREECVLLVATLHVVKKRFTVGTFTWIIRCSIRRGCEGAHANGFART